MTTTLDEKGSSSKLFVLGILAIVAMGIFAIIFLANNREIVRQIAESVSIVDENEGEALTLFNANDPDPAIGKTFPTIIGENFDAEEVSIKPDGRNKVIYFLAHWCRFCQDEVPMVQSLIDDGQVPEDVDIYSVVSLTYNLETQPDRPGNFPPDVWLETEDWTPPVILDTKNSEIFETAGASGTPFILVLDGDNKVVARVSGNIGPGETVRLWNSAKNGPVVPFVPEPETDSDTSEIEVTTDTEPETPAE